MKIILQENDKLLKFNLTKEHIGNCWISDSKKNNLINIEAENNKWMLKSNSEIRIIKNINAPENELLTNINQLAELELVHFLSVYIMEIETKRTFKLFCVPTFDDTTLQLFIDFSKITELIIGNDKGATIYCNNELFAKKQLSLTFKNGECYVKNLNINIPMFINGFLETEKKLSAGDNVFIDGLNFYVIKNLLIINNPNNIIVYDPLKLSQRILPQNPNVEYSSDQETFVELFSKGEYFQRPPRFKRVIEEKEYKIDPPPDSDLREEMPLIYTLGPMMLMGITSLMSGLTAILNVLEGKSTFKENLTPIITAAAMLGSVVVFPFLQKMYARWSAARKEKRRRKKYKKYIAKKKEEILQEVEIQRQILIENNVSIEDTYKTILNNERTFWDRKIEHPDFLNIRLGIGSVKPEIKVNVPEEHFTMNEDDLSDVYSELFETIKDIQNVPVSAKLLQQKVTGMVGNYQYVKSFLDGFMLKLFAFHSYDMLKIVILSSSEKKGTWEKYKNIPHLWNNEKSFRYIATDNDSINRVSNVLTQIFNQRVEEDEEDKKNDNLDLKYKNFNEYYLIISDEIDYLKNTSIFDKIINKEGNYGFSMLLITDHVDKLPNECMHFINIEPNNCAVFETELVSTNQQRFIPDMADFDMFPCYLKLCNVPIDIAAGKFELPKTYSFLEMYDVGNVKQLNILNKWKNNNPIQSLAAPVGINEQGEIFKIDLHEKFHGPHGLVAGMTGSGKSEWIITYILSMCVNYNPEEVQFVLIDYKGGGLAGTFENKETGFRIPHLVGTITNLDVSEINRSLASINSELKRRQALFNQARDSLGESSVDIYKYQRWYREGKIKEPISHLFLISDEFAELKAQQPEFMDELISTARIGRSLGVHLILATQKPSGVVNDQIWSNSKFRVCLKVQEKADSNDMILVPDAALLKETGRFFLQVGYNEFFAKGQSAYAGSPYYESDKHKKTVDTDLEFVSDLGDVYKQINTEKKNVSAIFKGEELPNILKEIVETSKQVTLNIKKLWLDAIPSHIYVNDLLKKYPYQKTNFVLEPVIGEYDSPHTQQQGLLTLPISTGGNVLIYGVVGSGKENLIQTMLYSLMTTYYSKEVNVYILDFGAEIFNCFKNSPIVGDIITSSEEDKIEKYFKFITDELEYRKELFKDFNGNYGYYIQKSGETLPMIVNIINNFDAFSEMYGDKYEDMLVKITREAEKYGMYFILTALSTNSVRFKLSQNFKQSICLQLNDAFDYKGVFGSNCKVIPKTLKGRGIIAIDDSFYEFQTAYPLEHEDLNEYINALSNQLLEKYGNKAREVKILPEKVDLDYIKDEISDLKSLPIGVYNENVEIAKIDFLAEKIFTVSSNSLTGFIEFNKSFVTLLKGIENINCIILDGSQKLKSDNLTTLYLNNNFEKELPKFIKLLQKPKKKQMMVVINDAYSIISSYTDGEKHILEIIKTILKDENTCCVFSDSTSNLEKLRKIDFINNNVSFDKGIFVGSGITNQYLYQIPNMPRSLNKELSENSGYYIKNGKAKMVKFIELDQGTIY